MTWRYWLRIWRYWLDSAARLLTGRSPIERGLITQEGNLCVMTLLDLEDARRLPLEFPQGLRAPPRGKDRPCKKCGTTLTPVLFTTGGSHGQPELFEQYPLAVDGWRCMDCGWGVCPASLSEEEVAALITRGRQCLEVGNLDEAEICFRRVVSSWPGYSSGHFHLGLLCAGRLMRERQGPARSEHLAHLAQQTEHHLLAALSGWPSPYPEAHLNLVRLYASRGELDRCEEHVACYLAFEGLSEEERAEGRRFLAMTFFNEGLERVRPYLPLNGRIPQNVSWLEVRKGLAFLEESLAFGLEESWRALLLMGLAHQSLGEVEQACEAFRCSYEANPRVGDAGSPETLGGAA